MVKPKRIPVAAGAFPLEDGDGIGMDVHIGEPTPDEGAFAAGFSVELTEDAALRLALDLVYSMELETFQRFIDDLNSPPKPEEQVAGHA